MLMKTKQCSGHRGRVVHFSSHSSGHLCAADCCERGVQLLFMAGENAQLGLVTVLKTVLVGENLL